MRLVFEHLIVNGYVIDVYGEIDFYQYPNQDAVYFVNIKKLKATNNGFKIDEKLFYLEYEKLFFKTLVDTELEYQDYLRDIYNGHQN